MVEPLVTASYKISRSLKVAFYAVHIGTIFILYGIDAYLPDNIWQWATAGPPSAQRQPSALRHQGLHVSTTWATFWAKYEIKLRIYEEYGQY